MIKDGASILLLGRFALSISLLVVDSSVSIIILVDFSRKACDAFSNDRGSPISFHLHVVGSLDKNRPPAA